MNDRHEQSRPAFEAAFHHFTHERGEKEYRDEFEQRRWEAWTRALDYAAEQQSARPAKPPLGAECPTCGTIPWHASKETEDELRALFEPAPTPLTRPDRSGWLPIETAPKDGTCILGLHGDGRHISTINYSEGHWRLELWGSYITKPTHWMPLPATPPPAPRSAADQ